MPTKPNKVLMELQQALLAQRDEIDQKLKAINLLIGVEMEQPAKAGRGIRKTTPKGRPSKMTTNNAILEVLQVGQLAVKQIIPKVKELKGKVSTASINAGLAGLKKAGKITSPARGRYALKK